MIGERVQPWENAAADSRLAEAIKRKFFVGLRQGRTENCDVCQQSFDLLTITFTGHYFVCRKCKQMRVKDRS